MIVAVEFLCVLVAGESSLHTGDNGRVPLCSCGDKIALVRRFSNSPTAVHKGSCTVALSLAGIAESLLKASCLCL